MNKTNKYEVTLQPTLRALLNPFSRLEAGSRKTKFVYATNERVAEFKANEKAGRKWQINDIKNIKDLKVVK